MFSVENNDRKEQKKKKVNFQNKCVSSQYCVRRRALGGVSPTFSQLAVSSFVYRPDRQRSSMESIQILGKTPLTTENVLLTKMQQNAGDFHTKVFRFIFIDSPKQMNHK
jgi:hypothetical protein